jgi:16S rRNA (guanine527-N7)-methyltransferase
VEDWARILGQLSVYLELILKWNARINLTAIRSPEEIVRRHFGESLFVGARLGACETLLDFGSGAGFPGIPIQLMRPEVAVTLAESRSRKAAFLQEVLRTLGLRTEVWAGRVEGMPSGRRFDVVAMRAVEDMTAAVAEAGRRAKERVLVLGTAGFPVLAGVEGFSVAEPVALPGSDESVLWIARRR